MTSNIPTARSAEPSRCIVLSSECNRNLQRNVRVWGGNPRESTPHADFDVSLEAAEQGGVLQLTPAFELNLDHTPELASFGSYFRIGAPFYGRRILVDETTEQVRHETIYHLDATAGAYLTLAEGHHLLLEHDQAWHPQHREGDPQLVVGGVALGYNVVVADALELIHQVALALPEGDEVPSLGVMTDFIATLPGP